MGVYKRGDSDTWWISYSVGGRQFRESAGTSRKAEAEALLAKRKATIFSAQHFPEKRKSALSIAALRDLWLEHAAAKRSIREDRQRFGAIVDFFGAATQLASLLPTDVDRFRTHLAKTGRRVERKDGTTAMLPPLRPATVNRHLALLRSALRLAEDNGYLHRIPSRAIKLLPERNKRDRVWTAEEYEQLCAAANPKLRLVIVLAYQTGMRLGEICGLTWSQIDLKRGFIRLGDADTKTDEGRKVPLTSEAIAALKGWPRSVDGRVLDVGAKSISPLFSRLVRKLELPDTRLHDARHSAATNLRRAGADVITIAAICGWKDLATLRRYQTVSEQDLRSAVDRLPARSP